MAATDLVREKITAGSLVDKFVKLRFYCINKIKKYTGNGVTTGNRAFAVCRTVCRGSNLGHTAKAGFAMCDESGRRTKVWHTAKRKIVVCLNKGPTAKDAHTAKEGSLPCA